MNWGKSSNHDTAVMLGRLKGRKHFSTWFSYLLFVNH